MTLLAEGILKTHWDQSVPVNLAHIAKAMQLVVAFAQLEDCCALLEICEQRKQRVLLDQRHPLQLQRYGVAHALGHLALHHLRPGMKHRIRVSSSYHVDIEQRMDREANDFALRLLIPEAVLRFSLDTGQVCDLNEVAHLFEVAPILIKQRMADLDLQWPQPLARQLRPEVLWDE